MGLIYSSSMAVYFISQENYYPETLHPLVTASIGGVKTIRTPPSDAPLTVSDMKDKLSAKIRRRRQNHIAMGHAFGHRQLDPHGEHVRAGEPAAHPVLVGVHDDWDAATAAQRYEICIDRSRLSPRIV